MSKKKVVTTENNVEQTPPKKKLWMPDWCIPAVWFISNLTDCFENCLIFFFLNFADYLCYWNKIITKAVCGILDRCARLPTQGQGHLSQYTLCCTAPPVWCSSCSVEIATSFWAAPNYKYTCACACPYTYHVLLCMKTEPVCWVAAEPRMCQATSNLLALVQQISVFL